MNAKIVLDMTSFKISDNSFSVSVSTIFNIDANDSQKSVAGGGAYSPLNSNNRRNFAPINNSRNKKRKKHKNARILINSKSMAVAYDLVCG